MRRLEAIRNEPRGCRQFRTSAASSTASPRATRRERPVSRQSIFRTRPAHARDAEERDGPRDGEPDEHGAAPSDDRRLREHDPRRYDGDASDGDVDGVGGRIELHGARSESRSPGTAFESKTYSGPPLRPSCQRARSSARTMSRLRPGNSGWFTRAKPSASRFADSVVVVPPAPRFVQYAPRDDVHGVVPRATEVTKDARVFRQGAIFFVRAAHDAHPVRDEIRHVQDPPLGERLVVPPVVFELIVRRAAHDFTA